MLGKTDTVAVAKSDVSDETVHASVGFMLCQHNKGHSGCFHGCQGRNNTNGHHDRFILLWRQRGGMRRPGAVFLFAQRMERAERGLLWHTDAGTRQILSSWICLLTSTLTFSLSLFPRTLGKL